MIKRAKHANAQEHLDYLLVNLFTIIDVLVALGTLGFYTSNLRGWALFRKEYD